MDRIKQFVRRKTGGLFYYGDFTQNMEIKDGNTYMEYESANKLINYLLTIDSKLVTLYDHDLSKGLFITMFAEPGETYSNVLNAMGEITNFGVAFWFPSHPDIIKYAQTDQDDFEVINVKDNEKIYMLIPNHNKMNGFVGIIVSDDGKVFQI